MSYQSFGVVITLSVILFLINPAQATLGVDLSQSSSTFSCFKQNGMQFAITRGYCSYGGVDSNGVQNLKNARAAGLIADAYHFPCRGKSAQSQADEFVNYFDARGLDEEGNPIILASVEDNNGMKAGLYEEDTTQTMFLPNSNLITDMDEESRYEPQQNLSQLYGTVWIDIETNPSSGCSWASYSASSNCQFLKDLVQGLKNRGKNVGIYSSRYQWETIMGSSQACASFTNLPVWYAHYDGVASFQDWGSVSFGGWSKPSIKQYLGDKSLCGSGVDYNFY